MRFQVALLLLPLFPFLASCGEKQASSSLPEEAGWTEEFSIQERFNQRGDDVHVIMVHDARNEGFRGTVLNVSDRKIAKVEISARITGGEVLGPSVGGPFDPHAELEFQIPTAGKTFRGFSVLIEVEYPEPEE